MEDDFSAQSRSDQFTLTAKRRFLQMERLFPYLYCQEDLEDACRRLSRSPESKQAREHLEQILKDLTAADTAFQDASFYLDGASRKQLMQSARIISSSLPKAKELEDALLLEMMKQVPEYASAARIMARLVNHLEDQNYGWQNLPLRLRILRQFAAKGHLLSFRIQDENGKSRVFTVCGGRMEILRYIKKKCRGTIPDQYDELAALIDEDIFDLLEEAKKLPDPQKRKKALAPSGKYGLIKMADDLAKGRFHTGGSTRHALYLFAAVYQMTFPLDGEKEDHPDASWRNLEKNLLYDYYDNFLMRCLNSEFQDEKCQVESIPSSRGINPRNFAEMVYLYFLRDQTKTPAQKIVSAESMMQRLMEKGKSDRQKPDSSSRQHRPSFQEQETLMIDHLFGLHGSCFQDGKVSPFYLGEEEFEQFIFETCCCYESIAPIQGMRATAKGAFEIGLDQNSAFAEYQELIGELNDQADEAVWKCGLWNHDALQDSWQSACVFCKRHPGTNLHDAENFFRFLQQADRLLVENALKVKNPERMTRTALLSAAYHSYVNLIPYDRIPQQFSRFDQQFVRFVNEELAKGFYPPLSPSNIIDMIVEYSAYMFALCG